ncbi:Zinc finger C2H2-type protein [Venturia nashicola]|uniref:Zinc finger C2H2-type protein n=1 Tax=Venturia nashicola TaxID=86259 RepID=A0A4Z1NEF0_9PEZI|nr:Zinc finger C2H2-type protein [Venturia nashicola]
MLVHRQPSIRQDHHHQFTTCQPQPNSQSTPQQQSQQFAYLQQYFSNPSTTSTPHYTAKRAQSDSPESTPSSFESPSSNQLLDNQYMSNSYYSLNPAIRVHHSTPTSGLRQQTANSTHQPGLPFESNAYSHLWDTNYGGNGHMVATASLPVSGMRRSKTHQRAHSSSSIGSSGSASPYTKGHATSYSYSGSVNSPTMNTASKLNQNYNPDHSSSTGFSNPLPTPTQTPTQDSFLAASYPSYNNHQGHLDSAVAAHLAMNQVIDTNQQHNEEDLPGMSHSGRQSISSMGQEPSTPRTIPDNYDDFKQPAHGENPFPAVEAWIDEYLRCDAVSDNSRHQNFHVPKLDRTVSDAYADELYNPAIQQQIMSSSSKQKQFLSPHAPNIVTERLKMAQMARSQSPTGANSRGVSPFRPDSPWASASDYRTGVRFSTAQQVRQQQKAQADAAELSQHMQAEDSEPKTISPKDALLEYNESEEEAKMPLFPQDNTGFGQQFGDGQQQHFQQTASQTFSAMDASQWANSNEPSAQTFSNVPISSQTQAISGYNFASPAMAGNNSNSMPFSSQNYRTAPSPMAASLKQEDTPDFPAQLTSMDSSASEAPPSSNPNKSEKPTSSLADSGTYTCTYHGCSLRFETPQKLQKHKREGHRNPSTSAASQPTPPSPGLDSAMTSADIMQRNSQAGPHKCERTNPTTGKPCNTIFSRPYDLTRHEDTIHNARKQKVRCALCVEEKTFSRNDALTRHMRVVHPEVDFPGKHRRRGAHD